MRSTIRRVAAVHYCEPHLSLIECPQLCGLKCLLGLNRRAQSIGCGRTYSKGVLSLEEIFDDSEARHLGTTVRALAERHPSLVGI